MNDKEREEFDKFDRDADEILKKTNPELYARYMEAKLKKDGI
jgi:hypothetical protein